MILFLYNWTFLETWKDVSKEQKAKKIDEWWGVDEKKRGAAILDRYSAQLSSEECIISVLPLQKQNTSDQINLLPV